MEDPQGNDPERDDPQRDDPQGDDPQRDDPQGDDPQGDDPQGDDPQGDDPQGDDPQGDDPQGDDPQGDDPQGDDPQGDDPQGDDPQGNSISVGNNKKIEEQTIINSLKTGLYESRTDNSTNTTTINNNSYGSNQSDLDKLRIIDPSTEYPPESLLRTIYKINNKNALQQLKRDRVIFITCPNDQMVNDAACFLFNSLKKENNVLECRILAPLEDKEKEICQSFQNLFINQKCKIGKGENTLLIIDDVDTILFDSFKSLTPSRINTIVGEAERNKMFVTILIHKQNQINILNSGDIPKFKIYNIQFLDVLLDYHNATEFKEKIIIQKSFGLWGKNEKDFYQWIIGFLREGKDRLEEEIQIREKFKKGDDLKAFLAKYIVKVKVDEILNTSPISIYVVFIATYLPELSLNKLEEILFLLLKNTTPILKTITTVNSKGKERAKKEEVQLIDIWNDPLDGGDKILYDAHIRFFEDEDGVEYYSFSEPYLSDFFKKYFKNQKRRFLQNVFKKIVESGVFFASDTKGSFLESLVALSLKMAIKDPEEFGIKRLLNIFYQAHYHEGQISAEDGLLIKIIHNLKKHHVLNRLCLLLIEIIKVQKLKQLVDEMLIAQINMGQHVVVFDVIKKLHHSPDFNSLFWLKRLIDNGTNNVRKEAYIRLVQIALDKPDHIKEFLLQLTSWHPGEKEENFSPSNYASLAFIIDFTLEIKCELPGEYPISYPLFLNSTSLELDDLAIEAIKWLFHPYVEFAINKIRLLFERKALHLETIHSDIIEYWYMMICGKTLTPNPECLKVFNLMLTELDKYLTPVQKEAIYISLQEKMARVINWLDIVDDLLPIGKKELEEREKALESGRILYQVEEYVSNLFYNKLLQNN